MPDLRLSQRKLEIQISISNVLTKCWQPIQNFKEDDQLWAKENVSVSQMEPSCEFAAPEMKHVCQLTHSGYPGV